MRGQCASCYCSVFENIFAVLLSLLYKSSLYQIHGIWKWGSLSWILLICTQKLKVVLLASEMWRPWSLRIISIVFSFQKREKLIFHTPLCFYASNTKLSVDWMELILSLFLTGASICIFSMMIRSWTIVHTFSQPKVILYPLWALGMKGFLRLMFQVIGLISRYCFCFLYMWHSILVAIMNKFISYHRLSVTFLGDFDAPYW